MKIRWPNFMFLAIFAACLNLTVKVYPADAATLETEHQTAPLANTYSDDTPDGDDEESLCGVDNRVPSNDARVGRIGWLDTAGVQRANCTAWLAANGSLLTAGHCAPLLSNSGAFIEFNIPPSNSGDGSIVHSAPSDQYKVVQTSIVSVHDDDDDVSDGEDWAVFDVEPNGVTNLSPFEAQGNFFRLTQRRPINGDLIRITGNGVDTNNAANQTTQTHTGSYVAQASLDIHRYSVDTTGANSGSPVIWEQFGFAVGVHTNAGCSPLTGGGSNRGTAFEHANLAQALENFNGTGTVHVDQVTLPGELETGGVFRPFNTAREAVNQVSSGNKVSIVTGTYIESFSRNIPMTLIAPVGTVTLQGEITLGAESTQGNASVNKSVESPAADDSVSGLGTNKQSSDASATASTAESEEAASPSQISTFLPLLIK